MCKKGIFFSLVLVAVFSFVFGGVFVQTTEAQCTQAEIDKGECYRLVDPLSVGNAQGLVCKVVSFLAQDLMPPIAVLMVLWASFLFLTAGADPGKVNTARQMLVWTAVGVLILILAPALAALAVNLFGGGTGGNTVSDYCSPQATTSTVTDTLIRLVNWFSWLLAVLAVAVGLYAGFLFMTAAGDAQKLTVARRVLLYAVVGVAVAILAFSIIAIVRGVVL